jgi:hypothetical protein
LPSSCREAIIYFTGRQLRVNVSVTSIWQDSQAGAATFGRYQREEGEIMGMRKTARKTAVVALLAMAWAGAPVNPAVSFAQPAPGAMAPGAAATEAMASSLSAADKEALMKKLQDAKQHDKIARAGWSQEPLTQATYDKKIDEIKDLIAKLKKGEDFPLSAADKAMASPKSAPY